MSEWKKHVTIDASAEKVWRVIADSGRTARWAPGIADSFSTTEINAGLGARRRLELASGEIIEQEIVAWDEGRAFTFALLGGFHPVSALRETWEVQPWDAEPLPKASLVIVSMAYRLKYGVIGSALDRLIVRRRLGALLTLNLAGLKHYVETGQVATAETSRLLVWMVL